MPDTSKNRCRVCGQLEDEHWTRVVHDGEVQTGSYKDGQEIVCTGPRVMVEPYNVGWFYVQITGEFGLLNVAAFPPVPELHQHMFAFLVQLRQAWRKLPHDMRLQGNVVAFLWRAIGRHELSVVSSFYLAREDGADLPAPDPVLMNLLPSMVLASRIAELEMELARMRGAI